MSAATFAAVLVCATAALFAVTLPASDPDLFWHLQSGDWMLDHGRLLDRDIFSFTRAGAPYASGQWLGQVALALAYRGGSWLGLDVLRAALVGLGAFFLARATLRLQPHAGWAIPTVMGTLLLSKIAWGDRPQLFTLALVPLLLDLLLAARLEGRTKLLALVPLVFLAWANLHGGFVVGLALVALVTLEAVVTRSRERMAFVVTLAVSVLATQVNPAGGGALGWAAAYASTRSGFIVEEAPPDVLTPAGFLFAMLLVGLLTSSLVLGRQRLLQAVLVVPFVLLGLSVQRQMPLAADVLAPFVAAAVPLALGRARATAPRLPAGVAAAGVAMLAAAVMLVTIVAAPRGPDLSSYPAGALVALRTHPGNLLNEYDWGGYLIHEAPEHPTFIDGRGALLFVPGVLDDFERAVRVRPAYREVLTRYDISLALLRPARPLADALRDAGWRTLAVDTAFVLLERP